jgi:hypothetical protein
MARTTAPSALSVCAGTTRSAARSAIAIPSTNRVHLDVRSVANVCAQCRGPTIVPWTGTAWPNAAPARSQSIIDLTEAGPSLSKKPK